MKISLLLVLSLFAAAQASAQAVELQSGADPREIKLYRATVRTMAGERISGIFYAMTDSTLVFFASDRAAIRQFRAGQLPKLDTVDATNVKRLAVRQKGQILRSLTLGLVTGAIVSCVSILMSRPARSTIISGVSNGVGQVLGNYLFVKKIERYKGDTNRFRRARNRICAYTIAGQQLQPLPARTGIGR